MTGLDWMDERERLRYRVIRWVNWHRSRMGLHWTSLPKGDIGDPEGCPVARAFAPRGGRQWASISTDNCRVVCYDASGGAKKWRTPEHVREFIRRFDDGEYPELIR